MTHVGLCCENPRQEKVKLNEFVEPEMSENKEKQDSCPQVKHVQWTVTCSRLKRANCTALGF